MIWIVGVVAVIVAIGSLVFLLAIENGRVREDARRIEEFWAARAKEEAAKYCWSDSEPYKPEHPAEGEK